MQSDAMSSYTTELSLIRSSYRVQSGWPAKTGLSVDLARPHFLTLRRAGLLASHRSSDYPTLGAWGVPGCDGSHRGIGWTKVSFLEDWF